MWPMPPYNQHYVTINLSPHRLSCCWFEQTKNQSSCYLKGYQITELDNLELERLIIFNPSRISTLIQHFVSTHQLKNAFVLFCLSGPSVIGQFISFNTATPDPEQFASHNKNKSIQDKPTWDKLIWDYVYLYPTDNGQFMFYAAGIKRELIFQYQLLALRNNLNLITITPAAIALLGLYKHSKGSQFRHSQLGIELAQYNNRIEQLFDSVSLNTLIKENPDINIHTKDIQCILPSLGLFLMRDDCNA